MADPVPVASLISWAAGIIVVVLFGYNRFSEETAATRSSYKNRVLSQIYVRDLTFSGTYLKYSLVYIFILLLIFATIAMLGSSDLKIPGMQDVPAAALPFASALLIAGLLPLPWVNKIELWLRSSLHSRVMITQNASELTSKLKSCSLGFAALPASKAAEIFQSDEIREHFALGHCGPETRNWLKASILIAELERSAIDPELTAKVGTQFINRYSTLLEQISEDRRGISEQLGLQEVKNATEFEMRVKRGRVAITRLYDDVYSFCACVLLLRPNGARLNTALETLDFKIPDDIIEKTMLEEKITAQSDAILTAYFIAFITSLLLYAVFNLIDPLKDFIPILSTVEWPTVDTIRSNLHAFCLDLIWIGLVLWAFFSSHTTSLLTNRRLVGVAGAHAAGSKAYLAPSAIALLVAVVGLIVVDAILLISGDASCIGKDATGSTCSSRLVEEFLKFPSKEWLKFISPVIAAVFFYSGIESLYSTRSPGHFRNRAILTVALSISFFAIYAINNELTKPPARIGFLLTYLTSLMLFWAVFVVLAWRNISMTSGNKPIPEERFTDREGVATGAR